jgi:acetyl esterase/lipase
MKSKFTIIFGSLVLVLAFSNTSAFPKSPDTSNYEIGYQKYVDSPEPLNVIRDRDVLLYQKYAKYAMDNYLPPNHIIKYGPHQLQALDIYVRQDTKRAPVIFFIHSGLEDKFQVQQAARSWLSLGYMVVSINHRFAPEYKFTQQVKDCFSALKWVMDNIHKYGGDGNRIVLTGFSAGGFMTTLMVVETNWHNKYGIDVKRIKCWIPISGFYSVDLQENYLTPIIASYLDLIKIPSKKDASPYEYVTGKEPPSLIIHGSDDWAVPKTNATALYNKLKEKGAISELAIFKGYMHANVFMGYYSKGHVPAKHISRFLAKYVPTEENH